MYTKWHVSKCILLQSLVVFAAVAVLFSLTRCGNQPQEETTFFKKAEPVWPEGREQEKNLTVGFRAEFRRPGGGRAALKVTGSTLYRIFLNGEFVGHGPARAGHGFYRVDEWDLADRLVKGTNVLSIEVAGYNVNSYYLLNQPSFLQAEVVSGNRVLAATSSESDDFTALELTGRVQKVPRYSFQRLFTEVYRLAPDFDSWRIRQKAEGRRQKLDNKKKDTRKDSLADSHNSRFTISFAELAFGSVHDSRFPNPQSPVTIHDSRFTTLSLAKTPAKSLLPRGVPYPAFAVRTPVALAGYGVMKTGIKREHYWKDRAVVNIGPKLGGFTESELELNQAIELQEMEIGSLVKDSAAYSPDNGLMIGPKEFRIFDFGTNLTGFVGATLEVTKAGRFFFTFDEILINSDVDFKRLGCISAITLNLEPGTYNLESFEPYTMKYLKIMAVDGECNIGEAHLREYANSDIERASFESSDPRLNRIYRAGVETFRQNAVDIFMDCPHRERAGWLCDSYFTSRVAYDLSGNSLVEKNFLENFALPDSFAHLPEGMLPMCYPSDHNDSVFIPNWAMWFVVELREYLQRSNDRKLVDDLKPRVLDLLGYFRPFENEDGLLEKLKSWIFVEWSAANNFVQDVNYPTNMLYAATLDAAGELYGIDSLEKRAEEVRETIRRQAYNGSFFVDNAVRRQKAQGSGLKAQGSGLKGSGKMGSEREQEGLVVMENVSEVCQYFAFYFGVADTVRYPELWRRLAEEFGPGRKDNNPYPEVHFANSFVGNYLRLELLARYGLRAQLLNESIDYFDYMALQTGTLWENISAYASCNHGFASHAVHVLYRDVLGIASVDQQNKTISFLIPDTGLDSCRGQIPVGNGIAAFSWKKEKNRIIYAKEIPGGFTGQIVNLSKLEIKESSE